MAALIHKSSPADAMAMAIAGLKSTHFRLSSYGPDFLEFFANKYMSFKRDRGDLHKLKVIIGPKAEKFYHKFVRNNLKESEGASSSALPHTKPVVFAFTVSEAGKKGVKFYKTWRDKSRKASGSGEDARNADSEHKLGFLDSEFDRVMGFLDSEFKRMSAVSNVSVTSLPFLRSVPLDTSRTQQEADSPRRVLVPTNPDATSTSTADDPPHASGSQRPNVHQIDTSGGSQDLLRASNSDPVVESPETALSLATPTANHNGENSVSNANGRSERRSRRSKQPKAKKAASSPLPNGETRSSRSSRSRSGRALTDGGSSGSHRTDASSEAGRSLFSRSSSNRTRGSSQGPHEDEPEFTIVLLDDGNDRFVDRRRERKRSPNSKSNSQEEVSPWWAHLGESPPSRPHTPRPFNPSTDNLPDDVSAWWTPHVSSNKAVARRSPSAPAKHEHRAPHPDAGTMTWKRYMEGVRHPYPSQVVYEPQPSALEPILSPSWKMNGPEYLPPVITTCPPSPVIYGVYASPSSVSSWKTYMSGYYSNCSGHISLPDISPYAPPDNPIFVDETGYPYPSG